MVDILSRFLIKFGCHLVVGRPFVVGIRGEVICDISMDDLYILNLDGGLWCCKLRTLALQNKDRSIFLKVLTENNKEVKSK